MVLLDALYDHDEVYDPDEVIPINSPLQKIVDIRLDPASEPPVLIQGDQDVDDFHLDTPWISELHVSGQSITPGKSASVLPSPIDAVILNQLCNGRIPDIGWQAQHKMLPPVDIRTSVKGPDHADDMDQQIISSNVPHADLMTRLDMIEAVQATIAYAREKNIRLVIRNTGHDFNGRSTGAGVVNDTLEASAIDFTSQASFPDITESLAGLADNAPRALEMSNASPATVESQIDVSQTPHHPQLQPGLAMPITPYTPNGPGPDSCSPRLPSSSGLRYPELMSPASTPSNPGELAPIMAPPNSDINGCTSQALPSPPGSPRISSTPGLTSPTSPHDPYTNSLPSTSMYPTPYGSYPSYGFVPRSGPDYVDPVFTPDLEADEMMDYDPPSSSMMARRRLGVPLSLPGRDGEMTVMACADTGADENTMTLEEADRIGLKVTSEADDLKEFCLANGKTISCVGKAISACNFSQGSASPNSLVAVFYVFQTLVEPIIMGLEFPELTETLSKHRDRLVELEVPPSQPLRVLLIKHLPCRLAKNAVLANADSGSDLDFVSGKYAKTHDLTLIPNEERIMLADGTCLKTSGIARLPLSVGESDTHDNSENSTSSVELQSEFHVFDDLIHDVLIGYATIEKLKVFTRHNDSLLPGIRLLGMSGINVIRHLKMPVPKGIRNLFQRHRSHNSNGSRASLQDGDEDQLANARSSMTMHSHDPLLYPGSRDRMSIDHMTNQDGTFVCNQPGCNAAPFQTQYLLDAHSNVHSSARPYFCPVQGCPRSEGGKGFKRKNEMIRHEIIHESLGYLCPFCTDREHKYPRPDNLQRHVRVHHTDKDKDDPQLREVLAQRPDGPNRGRRRRRVPCIGSY